MNWIDYEYPNTAYIVEVKYKRGGVGDIAISTIRCNDMPKNRSNEWGFTQGFWNYAQAAKYARHVAAELAIPAAI